MSGGILSSAYAIGNGVKEDYHKVFEYAKKSCDLAMQLVVYSIWIGKVTTAYIDKYTTTLHQCQA